MYSSSLSTWRRQREAADRAALESVKRGPKTDIHRAETLHIARLTRERVAVIAAVHELSPALGVGAACQALGLPRGVPARQRAHAKRAAMVRPISSR